MSQAKMNRPDVEKVADIVRDAGGRLVGRTRLQKLAYILELAGLGDGFAFEYRHYGPYSADLANAARKAGFLGLVRETEYQAAWGGTYSVFSAELRPAGEVPSARSELAKLAAEADPVELELAATAVFLSFETEEPWDETAQRKAQKASGGRLENAKSLYRRLSSVRTPSPLPKIA